MFDKYLKFALNKADYKMLESGEWFASITGYDGIWATGISVEETRRELIEVLEEWLILKFKDNDPILFFEDNSISLDKQLA